MKLIYSRKHSIENAVWWRPNEAGYTTALSEAGRYTDQEAEYICSCSEIGNNIPVEESDAMKLSIPRSYVEALIANPKSRDANGENL